MVNSLDYYLSSIFGKFCPDRKELTIERFEFVRFNAELEILPTMKRTEVVEECIVFLLHVLVNSKSGFELKNFALGRRKMFSVGWHR